MNQRHGHDRLRQVERGAHLVHCRRHRIQSAPASAQPRVGRGKKDVLGRRRAVLDPEIVIRASDRARQIARNDDVQRRIQVGKPADMAQRLPLFRVFHHIERPRPVIAGARPGHGAAQKPIDDLVPDRPLGKAAHAPARQNRLIGLHENPSHRQFLPNYIAQPPSRPFKALRPPRKRHIMSFPLRPIPCPRRKSRRTSPSAT